MTISQLKEDSKFLRLTEKQQAFVLKMCETNGNTVRSAHFAYDCKDDGSAKAMAYQQLSKPPIRALLKDFVEVLDKKATKEEALSKLAEQMRICEDPEITIKLVALIGKLSGWETKPVELVPEKSEFDRIAELEN